MTTACAGARQAPSVVTANLFCLASMLVWSAGLPAAEVVIPLLPPITLSAARLVLATAALLPLWWLAEGRSILTANWRAGIYVGTTFGFGTICFTLGQAKTDPVTVAILSAAMPIVGTVLEVLFDGKRTTKALVIGIGLSVAGALVALDPDSGSPAFGLGAIIMLASVVLYAVGSRLTITALPDMTPLGRTTITLAGATLVTTAVAVADVARGGPVADWGGLHMGAWGALALYSIGSLAIAQLLWIKAVGRIGITLSALHINATPFYVMLVLFALGGDWHWRQAVGAALVGLGVVVAQGLVGRKRS
jgi:drug/metabolite transporter (DMT)-like permease